VVTEIELNMSKFSLHRNTDIPFLKLATDGIYGFGVNFEQHFNNAEITQELHPTDFDTSILKCSESELFRKFSIKTKAVHEIYSVK